MRKPDLVLAKAGRPIAVVEAKARPVAEPFRAAVHRQLKEYVASTRSHWGVLADPERVQVFSSDRLDEPFASFRTQDLFGERFRKDFGVGDRSVIGERTLLFAIDRWLHELIQHPEFIQGHPQLQRLASDVEDAEAIIEGFWPNG